MPLTEIIIKGPEGSNLVRDILTVDFDALTKQDLITVVKDEVITRDYAVVFCLTDLSAHLHITNIIEAIGFSLTIDQFKSLIFDMGFTIASDFEHDHGEDCIVYRHKSSWDVLRKAKMQKYPRYAED